MKNLKTNWFLKHAITVFSCVLIIALGIVFLTHADPVTTTIGDNIATNNLSVSGNVTAGTWQGTAIGSQYGGTGANLSAATQGSVPYFSSVGTMSALTYGTSGYFLKTQGENNDPVWAEVTAGKTAATLVVAASDSLDSTRADYVCNGTADEAEIETALNALPAGGGAILLLEGTYTISSTIDIPKSNITLMGMGRSSIIKVINEISSSLSSNAASGQKDIVVADAIGFVAGMDVRIQDGSAGEYNKITSIVGNTLTMETNLSNTYTVAASGLVYSIFDAVKSDGKDGVIIKDLAVDGNYQGRTHFPSYRGSALSLDNGKYITVTNCYIQYPNYECIGLYKTRMSTIIGNILYDAYGGEGIHFHGHDGEELSPYYNTIIGNTIKDCYGGIHLDDRPERCTISGNTIVDSGRGLYICETDENSITGNVVIGGSEGVWLQLSRDNIIADNVILRCNKGIDVHSNSHRNIIESNSIQEAGHYGISIVDSDYLQVANNLILNSSQSAAGSYDGIILDNASYNNIHGNVSLDNQGTKTQRYGVNVSNVSCAGNNIANNDLRSNQTAFLNDAGTNTQIFGNVGMAPINEKSFVYMKNTSGGSLSIGDVVILKSVTAGNEITTTTAQGDDKVFGMVAETIANDASGLVQTVGKTVSLKVDGTVDIAVGDFLGTYTVVGIGMKAAAGDMAFAIALEAYATNDSSGVIDTLLITPRKL